MTEYVKGAVAGKGTPPTTPPPPKPKRCNISFMYSDGKIGTKSCATHGTSWENFDDRPDTCWPA